MWCFWVTWRTTTSHMTWRGLCIETEIFNRYIYIFFLNPNDILAGKSREMQPFVRISEQKWGRAASRSQISGWKTGKLSTRGTERMKRNLCRSGDSWMTAAADVLVELSLARTGTSAAIHLGMSSREKRKHFFSVETHSVCNRVSSTCKYYHSSFAQVCGGNPATTRLLRRPLWKDALLFGGNSPAGRRPSAWNVFTAVRMIWSCFSSFTTTELQRLWLTALGLNRVSLIFTFCLDLHRSSLIALLPEFESKDSSPSREQPFSLQLAACSYSTLPWCRSPSARCRFEAELQPHAGLMLHS